MRKILLYTTLLILSANVVYGFRISRPPKLSYPLDKRQVAQLNDFLDKVFNLQKGEFNLDIETTPKTNADNGDFWMITGVTAAIQYKMNDYIYSTAGYPQSDTNYISFNSDNELILNGTARVTKGEWLGVTGLKEPGTKPATFKEWGISGVWEFSDATDDTMVANFKLPDDMDRSVAPTFLIGWSTNTAVTTETAVWQLEYLYTSEGEDTTAAADETLTVNSNAVAQADGLVIATITGINLPSSTDRCVHIRIKRLGDDGDDDLTDTAELHGCCLSYTANKLGD